MTANFKMGQATVATDNTRDTLLFLAGSRLRMLAPDRFEKFKGTLAKWKIDGPWVLSRVGNSTNGAHAAPPEVAAIAKRMGTMRGLPTDADRARLTIDLVNDIRALPPGPARLGLIRSLSNVATEGDLGKEALGGVAVTLAAAMRDNPAGAGGDDYLGLAKLVRYEHLEVPSDASLEAAVALLALREQIQQENGFTVIGMDGKTYSLAGLKGRIVLLNFWATWCPPCRKEMPDMEKLYRSYEAKGLTVVAVSDEDRPTVEQFLAKSHYSFPVALDPDRKANTAFERRGHPEKLHLRSRRTPGGAGDRYAHRVAVYGAAEDGGVRVSPLFRPTTLRCYGVAVNAQRAVAPCRLPTRAQFGATLKDVGFRFFEGC